MSALNSIIIMILLVFVSACSDKSDKKSLFDQLQLGSPGVTKSENNLPKNSNVHVLEKNERIEFVDKKGNIFIHHDKSRRFKKGDVVIGSPDQKIMLKLKTVKNSESEKTEAKAKLGKFEDLIGNKSGSFSFETTPIMTQENLSSCALETESVDDVTSQAKKEKCENKYIATTSPSSEITNFKADKTSMPIVPSFQIDKSGKIKIHKHQLFSFELNDSGVVNKKSAKLMGIPIQSVGEKIQITSGSKGKYQATIESGLIEIIPTFRGDYRWESGLAVNVNSKVDTLIRLKMDVSYKTEGSIEAEVKYDLLEKRVISVLMPGAVPIYMQVELALPLKVNMKASGKSETRVVYEAEYAFQGSISYTPETGMQTTNSQETDIKEKSMISNSKSLKLEAEVSLQPTVETRFYRVLGPYAYFQPYIRGEFEYPAPPNKDDLYVGIGGGIGVQLSEPLFMSELLNLDSGRIFEKEWSWDLNSMGSGHDRIKIPDQEQPKNHVTSLTDEGFVTIDLKPENPQKLRYKIVAPPKHGVAVPSKNLFYDGEIYYFPMGKKRRDSMKVAIMRPDGKTKIETIRLVLSDEVVKKAGEERFGVLTNTTDVVYNSPGHFTDRVQRLKPFGGGGRRIEAVHSSPIPKEIKIDMVTTVDDQKVTKLIQTCTKISSLLDLESQLVLEECRLLIGNVQSLLANITGQNFNFLHSSNKRIFNKMGEKYYYEFNQLGKLFRGENSIIAKDRVKALITRVAMIPTARYFLNGKLRMDETNSEYHQCDFIGLNYEYNRYDDNRIDLHVAPRFVAGCEKSVEGAKLFIEIPVHLRAESINNSVWEVDLSQNEEVYKIPLKNSALNEEIYEISMKVLYEGTLFEYGNLKIDATKKKVPRQEDTDTILMFSDSTYHTK